MIVFPGQGSQHAGMLDAAPETDGFERLLDAAEALSDIELGAISVLGSDEDLSDTRVAQPLLYLTDWAWGTALLDSGLQPDGAAGHSLGELAALAIAGVYSVEAGLELVVERSKLMATQTAGDLGSMAAVIGLDASTVSACLNGIDSVWVANDNSDSQIVISGLDASVEAASLVLSEAGARRIIPLKVSGAFHTPLMEPAAHAFAETLRGADFSDAVFPVYQNADPRPTTDAETIRERLIRQMTSPVMWTDTMAQMTADGPIHLIEAGPGNVLTGLAKRIESVRARAVESVGIETVIEEAARS